MPPLTTPTPSRCAADQPPCAARPDHWDLDVGSARTWGEAIRTCRSCPLLEWCQTRAEKLIAQGDGPRSVIWAGVVYNASGGRVDDINRYRRPSKALFGPMRINYATIASNSEYSPPTVTPGRRHFVFGRRQSDSAG